MIVSLPYGEAQLDAEVPDSATVLRPSASAPVPNPEAAVRKALAAPIEGPPLASLVRAGQRVTVVVADITRPVPNQLLLPPLLDALAAQGVPDGDVTILIGTGLHRPSRGDERERILGRAILSRYRVLDHDARDESQTALLCTTARGTEVRLNRAYLDADVRIVTGFVEPHLFAGYSGGGKGVLPAIAAAATIMANHDATMVGHPRATWCVTDGNPIFEEMREMALRSRPSFLLNVTLDERRRITGVFAGDLVAAHDAAIAQAARQAQREIAQLFDFVVVTNMGYPADLVLYQAVKGMSVAAQACAPGGAILLVAECREGLGAAEYVHLLESEADAGALMRRIDAAGRPTTFDQWQVQVQAMVQARCDVWLHARLSREETERAHLRYADELNRTIQRILADQRVALGREPRVCVLPHGQLTVPVLREPSAS